MPVIPVGSGKNLGAIVQKSGSNSDKESLRGDAANEVGDFTNRLNKNVGSLLEYAALQKGGKKPVVV